MKIPKLHFLPLALAISLLTACGEKTEPQQTEQDSRTPARYVWVTGLDPEKADGYEELHRNPWPEVTAMIRECNIRNFSIHKREIDGKLYLIAYLEYIGDDFDADMKKMAADPHTQRWWAQTDPAQIPLPDAAADGKIWADTEEIFFLH